MNASTLINEYGYNSLLPIHSMYIFSCLVVVKKMYPPLKLGEMVTIPQGTKY